MDLRKFNKFGDGNIAQYAPPACYELTGQDLCFEMDDGSDYELRFTGKTELEWSCDGSAPAGASYFCGKGDETTYLVSYELAGVLPRTNHTFVIDLENDLVTRIISKIGEHPKSPYLQRPVYEFGAIRREGKETKPYPRHGFTSDVCGNAVRWTYSNSMTTVHVYYCTDYYRITYPPERTIPSVFNEAIEKVPSSDEPMAYIRIKDGLYLLSLTESNMERVCPGAMPHRSNTMCFLQDYRRVCLIGRAFGTFTPEGQEESAIHTMFAAFGEILDPKAEFVKKLFIDPNPYLV